jgi:tetratricopeptide (TPR) repeat protein
MEERLWKQDGGVGEGREIKMARFEKRSLRARAHERVRDADYDAAIDLYTQYLAIPGNREDDDAWAGLGGAFRRKGNIDKSIDSYENAFKINPESTYAAVNIISLRVARNLKQDQTKLKILIPEAIGLVKNKFKTGEAHYWSWYDLATLELIQGDVEEAIRLFNYAAELTPVGAEGIFRSMLSNLNFLKENNPSIKGISDIITIINRRIEA